MTASKIQILCVEFLVSLDAVCQPLNTLEVALATILAHIYVPYVSQNYVF